MNPAKDFVKVGVQSVLVLVPGRSAAAIVRMIAHRLPAPPVRHNEALWRTGDATQKRRAFRKMSAIKRLSRIAPRHNDQNIRHLKMPVARSRRHLAVNDRREWLLNEVRATTSNSELLQLALNS